MDDWPPKSLRKLSGPRSRSQSSRVDELIQRRLSEASNGAEMLAAIKAALAAGATFHEISDYLDLIDMVPQ